MLFNKLKIYSYKGLKFLSLIDFQNDQIYIRWFFDLDRYKDLIIILIRIKYELDPFPGIKLVTK